MALVFFGSPDTPVRCALEISKALKLHPDIQLRMGIHSGPVNQILDVNGNVNVAGAGINIAQRVMDCGDAGHILLSKRIADDLGQYSSWQEHLHDLGDMEVKHGVRVHIVNLYQDDAGNPELPEKFKRSRKKPVLSVALVASVLFIAAVGTALALWKPWIRHETNTKTIADSNSGVTPLVAERVFTYYLTPSDKGQGIEEERFTGNEQFRNRSKFRLVLIPEQLGALYLIARGPGPNRTESWHVLFPTTKNNNGSSQVTANQSAEARINFDKNPGSENLWIIWSTRPIPELETISKEAAADNSFEIKDREQIAYIEKYIKKYGMPEAIAEVDTNKNQTTIRGKSEIIIRNLVLKHFNF
jgi:hypothetical protein